MDRGASVFCHDWEVGRTPLDEAFRYQASKDFDENSCRIIKLMDRGLDFSDSERGLKITKAEGNYYDRAEFVKLMPPIDGVKHLTDYIYFIENHAEMSMSNSSN